MNLPSYNSLCIHFILIYFLLIYYYYLKLQNLNVTANLFIGITCNLV